MYYLIRVKDGGGGSMTGSFDLPDENEFDHDMLFGKLNAAVSIRLKRVFQST